MPRSPLPPRHGLDAAWLRTPDNTPGSRHPWATLREYLAERLPPDARVAERLASGEFVDAIAFRYLDDPGAAAIRPQEDVELVYRAGIDEYSGVRRLQLVAEWLRPLS